MPTNNEHLNQQPDLRFEPGIHPVQNQQSALDGITDKISKGDLGVVNVWNGAVAERMRGYSPGIVTMDSLNPIYPNYDVRSKLNFSEKEWIWAVMPGTPNQINGTDEVIVVAADNVYNFPDETSGKEVRSEELGLVAAAVGGAIVGAQIDKYVYRSRLWYRDYDHVTGRYQSPNRPSAIPIRRRSFFKFSGALALAFMVSGFNGVAPYLPFQAAPAIEENIDDALLDVNIEQIANVNGITTYTNGRTALVISKMIDLLNSKNDLLSDSSRVGSIVMGDGHAFHANQLMTDQAMRDHFISDHMKLMLEASKHDHTFFAGKWTEAQKRQYIVQQETAIQLFKVAQPDSKKVKEDPESEIERTVTYHGQMISPSVKRAIEKLV
jgi:hypothetical protein